MTKMSEPDGIKTPKVTRNCAEQRDGSRMARAVHGLRTRVLPLLHIIPLAGLVGAGCILPPSLDPETQEAAVNSPPAITQVSTDADTVFEPGPIALTRGSGNLNFELLDTDVDDKLFVRIFIDYILDDPTPARAQCSKGPGASGEKLPTRRISCSAGTICQAADDGKRRNLSAVVFDREPMETGDPPFQAMPAGGLSASKFFFVDCGGPQT